MTRETLGGEEMTAVVFGFGAPCLSDGLASTAQLDSRPSALPMIMPADAPSALPLARPADLLAGADVVEVYCESDGRHRPLLSACGYHLHSALKGADPFFTSGMYLLAPMGRGFMVRLPREEAWRLVQMEERPALDVDGRHVRIRRVSIRELEPCAELYAPIVVISRGVQSTDGQGIVKRRKVYLRGDDFKASLGKHLAEMKITAHVTFDAEEKKIRMGAKGCTFGYGVTLSGLTLEQSLLIQRVGLGGRGRMGAGVFFPLIRG